MKTTTLLRISLSTLVCGAACAETVQIQGAGATFPAPIYQAWLAAYNGEHPESHIDYQAIGSGGGIRGITDKTVQFAGSDAPLTNDQMAAAPGIMHLPTVAGPVVITYTLPGLTAPLILDGATIAGMYLGSITKWNAAEIVKLNPGVTLPDTDVVVVHRSDGSGTTWIFTNYLAKVSQEWGKVGNATSVKWPTGLGGKGNAGVADAVKNSQGAIGYVELAYAMDAKLPVAKLVNHDGKVVEASIQGVVEAAKHSPAPGEDLRVSITDAPGDESYPICGFTYLLIYQDLSYLKDKDKAATLFKFIKWAETEGQTPAHMSTNYSPLPQNMQDMVLKHLATVTCDGAPLADAAAK
jgi:phosphate transport system substrate-binding protein